MHRYGDLLKIILYIDIVATQIRDVGTSTGPAIAVNGIGGDIASLAVSAPSVWLQYLTVLRNEAWANDIFGELRAVAIAFDPAEISRFPTNLPYQYIYLGQHQSARQVISGSVSAPPGVPPFVGFIDAFQGFSLLLSQAINGPETLVWIIEPSASVPIIRPNGVLAQYGVFLDRSDRTRNAWRLQAPAVTLGSWKFPRIGEISRVSGFKFPLGHLIDVSDLRLFVSKLDIRALYDSQDFNFAGPSGENGFIEDYTAEVRGEQIGNVVLVTRNAAWQALHIVANYRPRNTLLRLSQLIGEQLAGTP